MTNTQALLRLAAVAIGTGIDSDGDDAHSSELPDYYEDFNKFCSEAGLSLPPEVCQEWVDWSLKATEGEILVRGIELICEHSGYIDDESHSNQPVSIED